MLYVTFLIYLFRMLSLVLPPAASPPDMVMQDLGIDLRLAVNYLPACACALQSAILSFVLCALHGTRLLPAFVPVCLLLVLDRVQPRSLRIFDGSAVLFSIFASHCVAAIQEFGAGGLHLWPALHVLFSVEWPCFATYLLFRPPAHRDFLRLCFACACFRVSCCAFLYRPDYSEVRLVRVGRDLAFAGLCLIWTYAVGLYRRRLSRDPSESATHFAVYFWPVLYAHAYAAAAYAVVALGVVLYQLRQSDAAAPHQSDYAAEPCQPAQVAVQPRAAAASPVESPPQVPQQTLPADADDEEMLRQLMGARQS